MSASVLKGVTICLVVVVGKKIGALTFSFTCDDHQALSEKSICFMRVV